MYFSTGELIDISGFSPTVTAHLIDGEALPEWLSFSGGRLYGTIPEEYSGSILLDLSAYEFVQGIDLINRKLVVRILNPGLIVQGGATADAIEGTTAEDSLAGGLSNDLLIGRSGADSLRGDDGDDVLIADSVSAATAETLDVGLGAIGPYLSPEITNASDNDLLYGGDGQDTLIGSSGSDYLDGGKDADYLFGSTGDDRLLGDAGDDIYFFEAGDGHDQILEYASSGSFDTIRFGSDIGIDDIRLSTPSDSPFDIRIDYGEAGSITLVNILRENSFGIERIEFSARPDWILDLSAADEPTWVLIRNAISGSAENDVLTGTSTSDWIVGNGGNDYLDGLAEADLMEGGVGDDVYVVDSSLDAIMERSNEGTDSILASADFVLPTHVEHLTLSGSAVSGRGNDEPNHITGSVGGNFLAGDDADYTGYGGVASSLAIFARGTSAGGVAPIMEIWLDGLMVDSFVVSSPELQSYLVDPSKLPSGTPHRVDVIFINDYLSPETGEDRNLNIDRIEVNGQVFSAIDNMMVIDRGIGAAALDGRDIMLTSTGALSWSGALRFNLDSSDQLNGGAGADTMVGGVGDDVYYIDQSGDVVIEAAGEGLDIIRTSISTVLPDHLEHMELIGSARDAIGNDLDNFLLGNALANLLSGGNGHDSLRASAGADTLDGGVGNDTLAGGTGNDTYIVDSLLDTVTEAANQGNDLLQSSVTRTLSVNVENLTLTGTASINGTGNTLDNVLTGNFGTNTLAGGTGNDTYIVQNTTDVVSEAISAGTDSVQSSVTFTLASNVENLTLTGAASITGTAAINGTGNTLNNLVTGNSAANTLNGSTGNDILEGRDGNDTLTDTSGTALFNGGAGNDNLSGGSAAEIYLGGTGNDTLTTGAGNDVLLFNKGDGLDTLAAGASGLDTLSLGGGASYSEFTFSKSSNDLVLKVGATDQLTFKDWYASSPTRSVTTLQVMAEAMADFTPGGTDPLRDNKVEAFDFAGLVGAFDAARTATPTLTDWALTNALADFQLAGSDTAALGGDLAYQYGRNGTLAGIGVTPALDVLSNAALGTSAQALTPLSGLQVGTQRLS